MNGTYDGRHGKLPFSDSSPESLRFSINIPDFCDREGSKKVSGSPFIL
ncbi:hypothetical protein B4135_3393 [Caldibacillus debilis]|uniref:Uncharacterized protein n=1 Tax=Caldibacillus debilis TaxID=301148 RepID=A0A150LFQ7_9BACI|nr:hypothetical protein B4135_3393 [Caldibacillus debilis]